jgi:two-component system phosphate regulon response regulator PhoB
MSKEYVLVVEDEQDILDLISYNLYKEGYDVEGATSGEQALVLIKSKIPDLILLDIMLPNISGLNVCKILKSDAQTQNIPIIMLTAKGEEVDIIAGLEAGASDYMTKPFSPKILIARVKAMLRRKIEKPNSNASVIKVDALTINIDKHEVLVDKNPIKLTNNEFQTLHLLAKKPGWVFTRNQIINEISGDAHDVTDRSIDVLIVGLRKKLQHCSEYVETVHGVGYRFKG